jgi:hypothetical protein
MATITNSTIIESVPNGGTQRNRYRYVIDTGEVHERAGWIPLAADANADMAMRGVILLDELAQAEFDALLGAE